MSQQTKNVSQTFSRFLKYRSKLSLFEKKDDPHCLCIFEFIDCGERG